VSIARAVVRLIGEIAAPQMRDADEHADAITAAILERGVDLGVLSNSYRR
jgi:hypothetical protein